MLLGKQKPDKFEVYNDYNKNLVNLFRCMRERPMAFIKELGFLTLNARDDFMVIRDFFKKEKFDTRFLSEETELTKIILPEILSEEIAELYTKSVQDYDLRRAVMFLLFSLIDQLSKRLEYTVIENRDFEVLIKHYDRENSFFYCDPPYFESEYMYDCDFVWNDHVRLYQTLHDIKGKFLVSYNDCKEIRELYDGCYFYGFKRTHSMVQKYEAGREFPELLIGNYDLSERKNNEPCQLTLF